MSKLHSLLGPSKAHRWTRCTGSLAACKHLPKLPTGEHAAEGTAYHIIAERALEYDKPCAFWIGETVEVDPFAVKIDAENAAQAQVYVDRVRQLPGARYYEITLDISKVLGVPDQEGTADCLAFDYENTTLHVDDLKFGRGEIVYAKGNEQLVLYAAAALKTYDMLCDWQHVRVAIHQPRADHYDEHTYTRAEIETLAAGMAKAAQEAKRLYDSGTPLEIRAAMTPGERQCRWCPLGGTCAARTQHILDLFPVRQVAVTTLPDEALGVARDRVDEIERWCADIKQEATARAASGRTIPGWKLVNGRRGPRQWNKEQLPEIETALVVTVGDAAYEKKIVSPTTAEKVLKKHPEQWAALQSAIVQSDGAPMLVRAIDPKPAIAAVEFGLVEIKS